MLFPLLGCTFERRTSIEVCTATNMAHNDNITEINYNISSRERQPNVLNNSVFFNSFHLSLSLCICLSLSHSSGCIDSTEHPLEIYPQYSFYILLFLYFSTYEVKRSFLIKQRNRHHYHYRRRWEKQSSTTQLGLFVIQNKQGFFVHQLPHT